MGKEDNLREILDQAVQEIAKAQSNPRTWLSWIVYLLARFEDQAVRTSSSDRDTYMEMLSVLQDEIRNRERTGGWN